METFVCAPSEPLGSWGAGAPKTYTNEGQSSQSSQSGHPGHSGCFGHSGQCSLPGQSYHPGQSGPNLHIFQIYLAHLWTDSQSC